jgi:hypothetical protein
LLGAAGAGALLLGAAGAGAGMLLLGACAAGSLFGGAGACIVCAATGELKTPVTTTAPARLNILWKLMDQSPQGGATRCNRSTAGGTRTTVG